LLEEVNLMVRKFAWDPAQWRFRAEEARTVADQMTHEEARTIMRRIANDYDRLARLAEEQLVAQERTTIGRES
jgi:multidrug resistance efflux pump